MTQTISDNDFALMHSSVPFTITGTTVPTRMGSNIWIASGTLINRAPTSNVYFLAGIYILAGILDCVRFTSSNSTGTFDAGSINIMYEG